MQYFVCSVFYICMEQTKYFILCALMLIASATLLSCSVADGESYSLAKSETSDSPVVAQTAYHGVWAVDGEKCDTLVVRFASEGKPIITFEGFPFKALANVFCPGVVVKSITCSAPYGPALSDEERLFVMAVAESGDAYCLESYVGVWLSNVGYSERRLYYELPPTEGAAYRCLPFVVTPAVGEPFALVADIVPQRSSVTLDRELNTLGVILVITRVHTLAPDGTSTVRSLSPEVRLTLTSIATV